MSSTQESVFDFDSWIEENGFESIKQTFVDCNMASEQSLSTRSESFSKLILNVKQEQIPRFEVCNC